MKDISKAEGLLKESVRPRGIVIQDGADRPVTPVIRAFIWGGKVRQVPTLPFGRWKVSVA